MVMDDIYCLTIKVYVLYIIGIYLWAELNIDAEIMRWGKM